jgi:hypothetical protein
MTEVKQLTKEVQTCSQHRNSIRTEKGRGGGGTLAMSAIYIYIYIFI